VTDIGKMALLGIWPECQLANGDVIIIAAGDEIEVATNNVFM
jgi:hypothetical protein